MKLKTIRPVVLWKPLLITLFLFVVGLSASSCDDGEQEQVAWRTALGSIDSTDTQIFSFGYTSAPPEGSMFYISVLNPRDVVALTGQIDGACSIFGPTFEQPKSPDLVKLRWMVLQVLHSAHVKIWRAIGVPVFLKMSRAIVVIPRVVSCLTIVWT